MTCSFNFEFSRVVFSQNKSIFTKIKRKLTEMNSEAIVEPVDYEAKCKALEEENEKLKQTFAEVTN